MIRITLSEFKRLVRETAEEQSLSAEVYAELLQTCKDEFGEENVRERPDLSSDDGETRALSMMDVRGTSIFKSRAEDLRELTKNVLWMVIGVQPQAKANSTDDWAESYLTDDVVVTLDMRRRETIVRVNDVPMFRSRMWGDRKG